MYRLTPRMEQHLKADLSRYHDLFDGDRCSGWELEELIVRAIRSDTTAGHHVKWREAGHDDKADAEVRTNGHFKPIQIKSGKVSRGMITLSGHRLGRFEGNLKEISDYLNNPSADIISVPYTKIDNETGRHHQYRICYIGRKALRGVKANKWEKHGTQWQQKNDNGVLFSLRPSMSWQIWWLIPENLASFSEDMMIT